ncbi:hypothetical protein AVEN_86119-1 [Araneus ventricosus]|uniref:SPOC domain-containing protein n=1 Tax=Araneus ventricosus TaxID=182803 RepID=A0A4Y2T6X0_ARAVE|nr:hypothetical protein AVEN_86119-1 [Araneus ventricosus]
MFSLFQKFPILWIGELIIKNVRTMVKLTYVSGDMRVAMHALPRFEPVPAIILCRRLRTNINEDFCYQVTAERKGVGIRIGSPKNGGKIDSI